MQHTGSFKPPPFSILWSPIPVLTWICPAIGHIGVSSSSGTALDFAGPYLVLECDDGNMLFGRPTRYLTLDPIKAQALAGDERVPSQLDAIGIARTWDAQLAATTESFRSQNYNLLGNNCHAFASSFLNQVRYGNSTNWNMVHVAAIMFLRGKHLSLKGTLQTWLPFIIIAVIGGYYGRLIFLWVWLGIVAPLVFWFILYAYGIKSARPASRPQQPSLCTAC